MIRSTNDENDDDDDDDEQYDGCECSSANPCSNCECVTRFGVNYTSLKCLNDEQQQPIFECNSECLCSIDRCPNRVSQQEDQSKNVTIVGTSIKGFGVVVNESLPHSGTFVGEYVGEVLTEMEARQRMALTKNYDHNYLLLYNEHQLQNLTQTFIDARHYGNWTRFINHSCEPNLQVVPIRIDQPKPPHLVFFTLRPIESGEELSYSYGTEIDSVHSKPCHCSSSFCKRFMPYQKE